MNIILETKVNIYTDFLIEKKKNIHSADQQGSNAGFE